MKRRHFLKAVVATPAGSALFVGETAQQPPRGQGAPAPPSPPPVTGGPVGAPSHAAPVLPTAMSEAVAAPVPRFFTPAQFATLRRLSDLFVPGSPGAPGALAAGAPEFLDHYIGRAAADRQRFYRAGLDDLDAKARARFKKPFADLTQADADAILKPMFAPRGAPMSVVEPGPFVNRVLLDVRTATLNSAASAAAQTAAGNPPPAPLYWLKVDPTT